MIHGLDRRAKLVLSLAVLYLFWGGSYLVTSIGVQSLPPFLMGAVRFTLSGLALFALARVFGEDRPRLDATEWRHLAITGFLTVLVSNGFNVWSLQWLPSNQAALLNVSSAFWITLLGTLGRRGHPVTTLVGTGLAIGAVGVALILWPGDGEMAAPGAAALVGTEVEPYPLGSSRVPQLGIMLGCFGWAVGTVYLRNVETRLGLLTFTGLQMFVGGLMLFVPATLAGDFAAWHWSPAGLAALLYLMVFNSLCAYTAYAWLSKHATPGQTGSYGLVNPAVATLLGWLVLDERLTPVQWIGTFVILAGVLMVTWPRAAPPPKAVPAPATEAPQ
ncbi:MAG: EamA family transporter [Steroidobacteraceae bacterium]|jgi:drug/metabolite transporter (DMT)-like permease|nr:EamA family transporter [Steroidobacteraceae bacterium]